MTSMMIPCKIICLDDSNRPNDIPISKWIKRNEIYTLIRIDKMNMQNGELGFELEEIDLSDCFPYTRFAAYRFGVLINPKSEVEEKELELAL